MDAAQISSVRAAAADADAVNRVLRAVWPQQTRPNQQVAAVLADPQVVTRLLLIAGRPVGVTSCFMTVNRHGQRCWELDLLALQPDCRGHGLGRLLVAAAVADRPAAAALTRALVAPDLPARTRLYARAGFVPARPDLQLLIRQPAAPLPAPADAVVDLIPVTTLLYDGAWLEGAATAAELAAAAHVQARHSWPILGVLLPTTREDLQAAAVAAGYQPVGSYRRWHLPHGPSAAELGA